jgi:hypothetical protein
VLARFFVLLAGLAHVTLPDGKDELWIREGSNNLIVATDTVGDGHLTEYPSGKETVALQIPFDNGSLPSHRVIGSGVCSADDAMQHAIIPAGETEGLQDVLEGHTL